MLGPVPKHRRKRGFTIPEKNRVGLDISVPETVMFKNGKIKSIITTNKHGRVNINHNVKDVSLHKVRL